LVTQIRAGSTPAFEELMRRYRRLAHKIAYGFTRDTDAATDVVQDTFLKVHEQLGTWRGEGEIKHWIARIAANEAMNHTRAARRRDSRELEPAILHAGEPPQHAELVRRESRDALHRSLALLPPRQRLAVVLRYFQGMSARDIGAVLECSEETARNTLLRSLRKLRVHLAESEEAIP
jgi:RNA polymerase sigma-70 factor (ECF subfamily)